MVSHLGLFCLPISHKKDAGLIWVNVFVTENDLKTGVAFKHFHFRTTVKGKDHKVAHVL